MSEYKVESVRWLSSMAILKHRQQEFGERDIFNACAKEIEDLRQQLQKEIQNGKCSSPDNTLCRGGDLPSLQE